MSTSLGSLAPWFGAKRAIASRIIEVIGPHRSYWEPFCGSMAVLLAKPCSCSEAVNDLHGDLVNLARCIKHPMLGPKLYRHLRRTMFSEVFFRESQAIIQSEWMPGESPDVERAGHFFLASWQGKNGIAGRSSGTSPARSFSSAGGDPAVRWRSAVRSIPQWRKRLDRVQVLSSDGIELCEKIEDIEGTVIYADPPYLVKSGKYKHDFGDDDHGRLAEALGRFRRTRVVVSYYDHPLLEDLYPGWTRVRLEATKSIVNAVKRGETGGVSAPEVLLVNGPVERKSRSLFDAFTEAS
jgi:DNA adenine methylase